jgi:hypothetical protein
MGLTIAFTCTGEALITHQPMQDSSDAHYLGAKGKGSRAYMLQLILLVIFIHHLGERQILVLSFDTDNLIVVHVKPPKDLLILLSDI